jgi:hypothetical protein
MGAYVIGGDFCRLTRQSVCPWQHHKAMLTDSTECMFPNSPSSVDYLAGVYVRGNGEPSAKQMNVDNIRRQKRNCLNKLTLTVV